MPSLYATSDEKAREIEDTEVREDSAAGQSDKGEIF
jgi:hypothetical protein